MECLKNPSDLAKCLQEFKKTIKTLSTPHDWCMKCCIEIYRLLENKSWIETVDVVSLCNLILHLSKHIHCTSVKDKQNFIITICNVYRHLVKKNVSYTMCNQIFQLVFDNMNCKMDVKYSKIYWIMLVDKFLLIDNEKSSLANAENLTDLTDDAIKLFKASDLMQFCKNNLPWLIKRIFNMFNNSNRNELEDGFDKIFDALYRLGETVDLSKSEPDSIDEIVYKHILYSSTLVFQNAINSSRDSNKSIKSALKFSLMILKSRKDYCCYYEILNLILPSIHDSIKGSILNFECINDLIAKIMESKNIYKIEALEEFCAVLRKILYLSLTEWSKKSKSYWTNCMPINLQIALMKLTMLILNTLSASDKQSVKCDNCKFNTAIHDALHLASCVRYFVINSAKSGMDTSELIPYSLNIFELQYKFIKMLQMNKCPNWGTLWSVAQKNIHENAILLHSLERYKDSIDLFRLHYAISLKVMKLDANAFDLNDFARGLYNMSICQMDMQLYDESLKNSYLSYALNYKNNRVENGKYITCAIQIKARALESKGNTQPDYKIQSLNVWNACLEKATECDILFRIMDTIDFGKLLINELEVYYDVWFSTLSIVGVCQSLTYLYERLDQKNLGLQNKCDLAMYCGMAVTLIGMHTSKLQNNKIANFVKFTLDVLESAYKSPENNFISMLLYGNTSKAYYECILFEKIKNDPPLNLSLKAPTQQHNDVVIHPDDICDIARTQCSLNLTVEEDILNPLSKSIQVWKEAISLSDVNMELYAKYKSYIDKTVEIMDVAVQTLSLHGLDSQSIAAADVTYSLASLANNQSFMLRIVGFIIEHVSNQNDEILTLIENCNGIAKTILTSDDSDIKKNNTMDYVFEYLLSLVIYYFNCKQKDKSVTIMTYVHSKILKEYFTESGHKNLENIKISYPKLIIVQSLFVESHDGPSVECVSLLTNMVNAYVECSELIKTEGRNSSKFVAVLRLWIECGLKAGKISLMLGLPRRARAILKSILQTTQRLLLPRTTAEILLMLAHIDFATERFDDCKVKIDTIDYILEEQNTTMRNEIPNTVAAMKNVSKTTNKKSTASIRQFEMVLDVPVDKYSNDNLGGSPIFCSTPYIMPAFIDHQNSCACKKCKNIRFFNVIIQIAHIKSQIYFKTGELNIANSYFEGSLKLVDYLKSRIQYICDVNFKYLKNLTCVNAIDHAYYKSFVNTETQLNVDASYFFITENDIPKAQSLNEHALHLITLFPMDSNLLAQLVYEQKIYFMHLKIFKTDENNALLELNNDFVAKLQLTPEKTAQNVEAFKTPCNRTAAKPSNTIQRPKRNIVKVLSRDIENDKPEFVRPTIKLNLDADDAIVPEPKKDEENIEKTPAPKIRMKKCPMSENRATRSKTTAIGSALKTPKNTIIRSTSPGSLGKIENNKNVANSAVKRTVRLKRETKTNLSPDVDLVKKYSIRRKL